MRFRFLSTPSGRRATFIFSKKYFYVLFLSTPSGRRATLTSLSISRQVTISIHALRVEGDGHVVLVDGFGKLFLSTPSGWRATIKLLARCYNPNEFLSTPSGWRATKFLLVFNARAVFLSTPSGWRATNLISLCEACHNISIHALRVEGDGPGLGDIINAFIFLSTPSGWRATHKAIAAKIGMNISIHALRVEGDGMQWYMLARGLGISIHALRVEGDRYNHHGVSGHSISIHALRVEGDLAGTLDPSDTGEFLSTPSGWRATAKTDKVFICFCAKGRRICLFKTRKEKICR